MSDMLRRSSLHSVFSVDEEIASDDTRFLRIIIDLMHTGKNLNGSYFEKSVVNECIDSIKNTPVLGFIRYDGGARQSDFNGHEYIIVRTENGVEERYIGSCYGVIPESCNPRWVMKMCDDGVEREFLQVDAILWEKFSDATGILRRDGEKSESMELEITSIDGYEDDDGVFYFTKFRFDGACILGDKCSPAMLGANVRLSDGVNFTMNDVVSSVRTELNDKFEMFNAAFTSLVNDKSNRGGVENMSNTDLEQVVETQPIESENEVVEFEAVETEAAECEEAVEEVAEEEAEVKAEAEAEDVIAEPEFADAEAKIADIEADYEKVKSDYDEMVAAFDQLKLEYEAVKAEYDNIKPKYDEYVQAEEQREMDELDAQKDAKFAEYEDVLCENADFIALKEKKGEMSVDDIERECAVMFVKATRSNQVNFSKANSTSAVVGVLNDGDSVDDGYVHHSKYGNIRRSR